MDKNKEKEALNGPFKNSIALYLIIRHPNLVQNF